MSRFAFVTLLTSDSYLPGALNLAAALADVHLTADPQIDYRTVCVVTPESLDVNSVKLLRRAYSEVVGVEILEGDTAANLRLLGREDLTAVLTKLHVFRLTQYDKLIFLDADVLPIRPLSHLFLLPYEFSAVPDVGWPDIFNSGVFVFSPGEDKFNQLMGLVRTKGTWDGGDQGILNEWRGQDWHRLSFIYNTTPTAAYTYAPAYEKFGSQISAIHFIGPNKPWASIPYRAPGSQASTSKSPAEGTSAPSAAPLPSYAYGSLLDKWFDVYDRHYRQPDSNTAVEAEHDVQKYTAVWDEPTQEGGNALGLEDLRRLALEGVNVAGVSQSSVIVSEGEGKYYSLPLEGRLDLMRPKRATPPPTEEDVGGSIAQPQPTTDSSGRTSRPRMETLPTPGPDEQPPAPHAPPLTLPSSDQTTPTQESYQYEGPDLHHHSHHHGQPVQHHSHQPGRHQHEHREDGQHDHQHHDHQYSPRRHEQQEEHHFEPPMMTWNAAVEPPPKEPPPTNAFPSDSYFPNVWDQRQTQHRAHHPEPHQHQASDDFFQPPPPSQIPRQLLREGHYANVTGQQHGGDPGHVVQPQPDRTKVSAVFPWEGQPRQPPGRVFPRGESPLPVAQFIGAADVQGELAAPSLPEVPAVSPQAVPPSPPSSKYQGSQSFRNAWDSVPSIQRYASKLVRPTVNPNTPQPWPMAPEAFYQQRRGRKDSYQSWDARPEVVAQGSDQEDDGDDEDSEEEEVRRKTAARARSGSSNGSGAKASASRYFSKGVQTIPPDTRSFGVQVSLLPETSQGADKELAKTSRWHGTAATRSAVGTHPTLPMATMQHISLDEEQHAVASPVVEVEALPFPSMRSFGSAPYDPEEPEYTPPTGVLSPRLHETQTYNTPARSLSPTKAKSGTMSPPKRPPIARDRSSSNETASVSTPSTGPPESPSEQAQQAPPLEVVTSPSVRRKIGRVWDPARGVDVFKRSSEEVLARFLRMGSWETTS